MYPSDKKTKQWRKSLPRYVDLRRKRRKKKLFHKKRPWSKMHRRGSYNLSPTVRQSKKTGYAKHLEPDKASSEVQIKTEGHL